MIQIDYPQVWKEALPLSQYWPEFQEKISHASSDDPYAPYLSINWQRVQRISKHVQVSSEWTAWLQEVTQPFKWLIITEPWCGDAAQIVPVLERMAEVAPEKIALKVVYRDQNLDLMDQHLTHGSRSIPKVLALSSKDEFLGNWGPRPAEAQALRAQFGEDMKAYADALHHWYARNKQVAIQAEILAWMKTLLG